jgi:predicted RecA/RadA family phage recombinase
MKNFVQPGDVLSLTAPYALATAGLGFLVGSLFAVSLSAAGNGAPVEGATRGVFDLVKVGSQAWTVGARIYWDDTAKACTTTASTNKLIGVAVAAVGSGAGETTGRVLLTGAFTL